MNRGEISSFNDVAISEVGPPAFGGPDGSSFTLVPSPLSTTPVWKDSDIQPWKGWPPQYLGTIPPTDEVPVDYPDLIRIHEGTFLHLEELKSDYKTMKCPLVDCWSAELVKIGETLLLQLPQFTKINEIITTSKWRNLFNDEYPSRQLLVRECYVKISNAIFTNVSAKANKMMQQMIVSGTPGTGKSFFLRYLIWRLFHPDGEFIREVPDTIVAYDDPASRKGWVYRRGHFYKCENLASWMASNDCDDILDDQNAWLICDGAIPPEKPRCKMVVITSPGNLTKDKQGAKAFYESTPFGIYFPTWSFDECEVVAKSIYNYDAINLQSIKRRYSRYGGIPRFVLEWHQTKPDANPLGNAVVSADIHKAVNDLGSSEFDHQAVSGKIIHLIPSADFRTFTYEWASTDIMEICFERLFNVMKSKIQCLLNSGQGLHMDTLYGILFEPWFHRKMAEQGLNVKIRPLKPVSPDARKRKLLQIGSGSSDEATMKWPPQKVNRFFDYQEIDCLAYNIPHVTNFPAVDSFCPSRGELFQITAAEQHEIKAAKLDLLKPYFKRFLASGAKAKLYFVVPPHRYNTFKAQRYIYPPTASTESPSVAHPESQAAAPETDKIPAIALATPPAPATKPTAQTKAAKLGKNRKPPASTRIAPPAEREASTAHSASQAPGSEITVTAVPVKDKLISPDWIEQWALELDVNPLSAAMKR